MSVVSGRSYHLALLMERFVFPAACTPSPTPGLGRGGLSFRRRISFSSGPGKRGSIPITNEQTHFIHSTITKDDDCHYATTFFYSTMTTYVTK